MHVVYNCKKTSNKLTSKQQNGYRYVPLHEVIACKRTLISYYYIDFYYFIFCLCVIGLNCIWTHASSYVIIVLILNQGTQVLWLLIWLSEGCFTLTWKKEKKKVFFKLLRMFQLHLQAFFIHTTFPSLAKQYFFGIFFEFWNMLVFSVWMKMETYFLLSHGTNIPLVCIQFEIWTFLMH